MRALDTRFLITAALQTLGDLALARQDLELAEQNYRAALDEAIRDAMRSRMAAVLSRFARLYQARGDHAEAVRLLSACASVGISPDVGASFVELLPGEDVIAKARAALGEEAFTIASAAGQALTLEQPAMEALR